MNTEMQKADAIDALAAIIKREYIAHANDRNEAMAKRVGFQACLIAATDNAFACDVINRATAIAKHTTKFCRSCDKVIQGEVFDADGESLSDVDLCSIECERDMVAETADQLMQQWEQY